MERGTGSFTRGVLSGIMCMRDIQRVSLTAYQSSSASGKTMDDNARLERMRKSYDEILDLLDRHGLLKERLPFTPGLLEEALFFTYKLRLIAQGKVKDYLGLDRNGLRKLINEWNSGDEGNCTCRVARNPFAEEE